MIFKYTADCLKTSEREKKDEEEGGGRIRRIRKKFN